MTMEIRKELYSGTIYADGTSPVVIRISHRGIVKRIYTSVKCDALHWNEGKECVTDEDVSHRHKNEAIDSAMRRIAGRLQDYLDECLALHLGQLSETLLNEGSDPPGVSAGPGKKASASFLSVIDKKIDACASLNTKRGYNTFRNYFNLRFGNGPSLTDLDRKFVCSVASMLERDNSADSTMRQHIGSRFKACSIN